MVPPEDILLAKGVKLAYGLQQEPAVEGLGWTLLDVIDGTDLKGLPDAHTGPYGFVATSPDGYLNVCIRGTVPIPPAGLGEWAEDFAALLVNNLNFKVGRVEEGFGGVYESLCILSLTIGLKQYLTTYLSAHPGTKVRIGGHSLGGALANLLFADLLLSGVDPTLLFCRTWGEPRNTDVTLAQWIEKTTRQKTRYVTIKDPVPQVPIPVNWGFLDFAHSGTAFVMNSGGVVKDGFACAHSLDTYLNLMSGGEELLDPYCAP